MISLCMLRIYTHLSGAWLPGSHIHGDVSSVTCASRHPSRRVVTCTAATWKGKGLVGESIVQNLVFIPPPPPPIVCVCL